MTTGTLVSVMTNTRKRLAQCKDSSGDGYGGGASLPDYIFKNVKNLPTIYKINKNF